MEITLYSTNERENSTIVIDGRNSTLLLVLVSFLSTTWSCSDIELKVDVIIASTPLTLVVVQVDSAILLLFAKENTF